MRMAGAIFVAALAAFIFCIFICLTGSNPKYNLERKTETPSLNKEIRIMQPVENDQQEKKLKTYLEEVIKQRNDLSKRSNSVMKDFMRYQCEHEKGSVSASGGWCSRLSGAKGHHVDKGLAPGLAKFFAGKSVGSLGDGSGEYKTLIEDTGLVTKYDAFDGSPFCKEATNGLVEYLDLTLPAYGLPIYDWIISLEVAEHIPKTYEDVYINNVMRHAKEGVVISWATPKQGGTGHVNEKPMDYVKEIFIRNGFTYNKEHSKVLKDASRFPWLMKNIMVFNRSYVGESFNFMN